MGQSDWRSYVNDNGDFELPNYVHRVIWDLMKFSLDMGEILSTDDRKLRAYKENVKRTFKSRWYDIAQALEEFDIVEKCGCSTHDYCDVCGGSRYLLSSWIGPDNLHQISLVIGAEDKKEISDKLQRGLATALREVEERNAM
jgi:hypothetical protein